MEFKIYSDNLIEAEWFRGLSSRLDSATSRTIKLRGHNPNKIEQLIAYDRPDIILTKNERPVLVVEKTREVPSGHNVGQRVARMVRAAEQSVPSITLLPFRARKHGANSAILNINVRLLNAFDVMSQIHQVPVLAVDWPSDESGELEVGGDQVLAPLLESFLDNECNEWWDDARSQLQAMRIRAERGVREHSKYALPPPSVQVRSTREVLEEYGSHRDGIARQLLACEESVVYSIGMNPESARRQDPYTGAQFIYDYLLCRNGTSVEMKYRNLFLRFPKIRKSDWQAINPYDPSSKSSNWYLTANALMFSDGIQFLRESK